MVVIMKETSSMKDGVSYYLSRDKPQLKYTDKNLTIITKNGILKYRAKCFMINAIIIQIV